MLRLDINIVNNVHSYNTVQVSKCLLMGLQFLPDMIFVTIGATGGGVKFLLTLDH